MTRHRESEHRNRGSLLRALAGASVVAIGGGLVATDPVIACDLGGQGTEALPYLVNTYQELVQVGADCDLGATYRLAKDIDASVSDTANGGIGFIPIGNGFLASQPFTGTFHGGNHSIRNLRINDSGSISVGLFNWTDYGSLVDSIHLVNANIVGLGTNTGGVSGTNAGSIVAATVSGTIVGGASNVGGIAGENQDSGKILLSRDSCTITSENSAIAGGLAGANSGYIFKGVSTGRISAGSNSAVGGLAGLNGPGSYLASSSSTSAVKVGYFGTVGGAVGQNDGTVRLTYVTGGDVSAGSRATGGGLVGQNTSNGFLVGSFSTGRVVAGDSAGVGGVAGDNSGIIDTCHSSDTVRAGIGSDLGGVVGTNQSTGVVWLCYATGRISADRESGVGGLVGTNWGSIAASYAADTASAKSGSLVGGIAGYNQADAVIANSYAVGRVSVVDSCSVGGLAGGNAGWITTSYSSNSIVSTAKSNTGGVVGQNENSSKITYVYWNNQTSGLTNGFGIDAGSSGLATGMTIGRMMDSTNYDGFSFAADSLWTITQGKSYPSLRGVPNSTAPTSIGRRGTGSWTPMVRQIGRRVAIDVPRDSKIRFVDAAGREIGPEIRLPTGRQVVEMPRTTEPMFLEIVSGQDRRGFPLESVR